MQSLVNKTLLDCGECLGLENEHIPDGSLVMGSPGKIKSLSAQQIVDMQRYAQHYNEKIKRYQTRLKRFYPQEHT